MNAFPKALSLYRWQRGQKDDSSFAAFTTACKVAGPRNLVQELFGPFQVSDAAPDVAAALAGFRNRPWYSAAELARLWPLICIGLASKEVGRKPSPATVAKRLIVCGLPRVKQWGGSHEFMHYGKPTEFFIVQDVWRISNQRYTQLDFDRVMSL